MMQKSVVRGFLAAVAVALTLLFLAACGPPPAGESQALATDTPMPAAHTPAPSLTPLPATPIPPTRTPAPTPTPLPATSISPTPEEKTETATVPAATAQEVVTVEPEVEKVVAAAKADLVERLGAAEEAILVKSVEAVEWPNTSLGCPQPGMMYLQVITPGFRVLLEAGGQTYEYHTDRGRVAVLCESASSSGMPSKGVDTTVDDGWPNQPQDNNDVINDLLRKRKP